jgi:hypothetical protein
MPFTLLNTLGVFDFILVPLPAPSITAQTSVFEMLAVLRLVNVNNFLNMFKLIVLFVTGMDYTTFQYLIQDIVFYYII